MSAEWIFPPPVDARACAALAEALGVPPRLAALLCRRGYHSSELADAFLEPRLKTLQDPFLLDGMEAAVARVWRAIEAREPISIYGDYDVDGVTSTTLLMRILRAYGVQPRAFLPDRLTEGYGLTAAGARRCVAEQAPRLLIAVDCGTASAAEIRALKEQGVETVVLDHHLPPGALPECTLVNPKLQSGREWDYLCSVGLSFKLAHALMKRRPLPGVDLREYLDLVALGTVADLVPLVAENRIFVRRGLAQLAQTRWPGLAMLTEVARLKAPFTATNLGYALGPRINAAGRLGTAEDALKLLLAETRAEAAPLAAKLDGLNRSRREVEDAVLVEAEAQAAAEFRPERDAAVVVGAPGWHSGVIGIVASRLQRRYHRPVLVAGFDEHGRGKGSGRSISGYSLVQALAACGHLLERHGGHDLAAGFSLAQDRFAEFRTAFVSHANGALTAAHLLPRLHLDGELTFADVSLLTLQEHARLEPYGMGNSQPLFFARGVEVYGEPRSLKEKHLSLRLRQGRREVRAVWFDATTEQLPRGPLDIAFRMEANEWEGTVRPQIQLRAVRASVG